MSESVVLPPVAPSVLADAVEALPSRLRKRLDDMRASAREWPVVEAGGGVVVTVDAQTTVTLATEVRADADAVCNCLLAPRCIHRTAVLAIAPVLTDAPQVAVDAPE